MISFVHAIYVLILDIFFNKIAFSAFFLMKQLLSLNVDYIF